MRSMRLTSSAIRLLKKLAKKNGVTQTAVMEIALRRLAEAEKVK